MEATVVTRMRGLLKRDSKRGAQIPSEELAALDAEMARQYGLDIGEGQPRETLFDEQRRQSRGAPRRSVHMA